MRTELDAVECKKGKSTQSPKNNKVFRMTCLLVLFPWRKKKLRRFSKDRCVAVCVPSKNVDMSCNAVYLTTLQR